MSRLTIVGFLFGFLLAQSRIGVVSASVEAKAADDATARIEAALESPRDTDYLDTQLADVVTDLEIKFKIGVQIDSEALAADGKGSDMPITGSLRNLPLRTTLNRLLIPQGLDWTVRDEVLLITTPTAAEQMTVTKVYPVGELVTRPKFDHRELIEVLMRMIAPSDWQENGGTVGAVSWNSSLRALVVTTTYRRQGDVAALLTLPLRADAGDASAGVPMFDRTEVDEALRSKTEIQYLDTPLNDVVADLRLRHKIHILIDEPALAAEDVSRELPITAVMKDASLASTLNRVLHSRRLDWTIVDGIVMITTETAAKQQAYQQVRSYPIGDLLDADAASDSTDELIDTLTMVVTPNDWMNAGGDAADITAFAPTKSLIVRHHEQGHRALAALLRQLRDAKESAPTTTDAKPAAPLTTKFYPIADLDAATRAGEKEALQNSQLHFVDDAAMLVRTLLTEVQPNSWLKEIDESGPSILVDRLTRSLIVRQTKQGHKDVAAFLQKVREDLDPQAGGFGGGGPNSVQGGGMGGGGGMF